MGGQSYTIDLKKGNVHRNTALSDLEINSIDLSSLQTQRNRDLVTLTGSQQRKAYIESLLAFGEDESSSDLRLELDEVNNEITELNKKINENNAEIVKLEARQESVGSVIPGMNPEIQKEINRLNSEHRKWTARSTLRNLDNLFTQNRGLGDLGALFFSEDDFLEWRNGVEKVFTTFNLGTEYYASDICSKNIKPANAGVAYADTPAGLAQIGAYVQATRTAPLINESGTYYIYRITFKVKNGDYDKDFRAPNELIFNVDLHDTKALSKVTLFKKDFKIGRGNSTSRTGNDAIVKESKKLYQQICLQFKSEVPQSWTANQRLDDNKLCTPVAESNQEPSKVRQQAAAPSSGSSADNYNDDW